MFIVNSDANVYRREMDFWSKWVIYGFSLGENMILISERFGRYDKKVLTLYRIKNKLHTKMKLLLKNACDFIYRLFDSRAKQLVMHTNRHTIPIKPLFIIMLMLATSLSLYSQKKKNESESVSGRSVNISADKLSDALEKNVSDEVLVAEYMSLAKDLSDKKSYTSAEGYLNRALNLCLKLKKNDLTSSVYRELAKVQEFQGRTDEAIASYRNAARIASDNVQKQLNENDANRLAHPADLMAQSVYVQSNIDLSKESKSVPERISARRQMADIKKTQNDNQGALAELEEALIESDELGTKDASFEIRQDMASTLSAVNMHEEAIELNRALVDEAQEEKNPKVEVKQLQNLAVSYLDAGRSLEAINSMKEAYTAAINNGLTLEAKDIMTQMVEYYKKERNTPQALNVYSDFIDRLDSLVKNDSTLVDEKFFKLQEDKITQLEKERALKDELINKTNRNNNILLVSITLIVLSLAIILKVLHGNLRKNKKIALQSLRREMNPHFIFNSLNSVNQFISENNELEANKYLSSYSKLMRTMMENSNKDFIPLATELGQLRQYLELEYLRFRDKFTYTINIDESLDSDSVMIPNMLIQPQLENAVWHGLRYKDSAGTLSLSFVADGENILVVIEDNGIGLKKSMELKTEHQKAHNSRGQTNTRERINLLNHLYNTKITIEIIDKAGDESGVLVKFLFPHIDPRKRGFTKESTSLRMK